MFDIKETCLYKGLVEYILDKKVRIFTKDTYSCYKAKKIFEFYDTIFIYVYL